MAQLKTQLTDRGVNEDAALLRKIDEMEAKLDRLSKEEKLLMEAEWGLITRPDEMQAKVVMPKLIVEKEDFFIDRTY